MKKITGIILLLFVIRIVGAQVAPDKYYIQFTDKNNSPYTLDHPEDFLTQRAIDRRQAHNIPFDEKDLPVNPQYLQGVADAGAQILNPTRWLNGVTIYTDSDSVLNAIQNLPYVDHTVFLKGGNTGEKPYFKNETVEKVPPHSQKSTSGTLSYDYGEAYNQIAQINGIGLHDMGYRGEGMVIAVLDAGFTGVQTHPLFDSLWANNRILGTKDFVYPGGDVFQGHWHGRMVLSCMGANIPSLMIGTAPKASYWLLRSEEGPAENVVEEYNWVSAAEFADSVGADVINSSLGYIDFDNPAFTHPYSDMDGNTCISSIGADIAASKGILVTNSAGNSGDNITFPWIGAPADGDSVFTIGAVDGNGNRASFSSKGPTYDGRIKPVVMAKGQGTTVADDGSGISYGSGTSFSSPVMAGMTACLWQAHPEMSNMEIIEAIKNSASQHNNPDNYMGWGIPDFMEANSLLTTVENSEPENAFATVYPNPCNERVVIRFNQPVKTEVTYALKDLMGKTLLHRKANPAATGEINLSLSSLSPGIYFMVFRWNKNVETVKIVKE